MRSRRVLFLDERLGMYQDRKLSMPRRVWSSSLVVGLGIFLIVLSFSGSGLIPSLLMIPNVHFSRLNLTPFSLARLRTAWSLLSCSS